MRRDNLSKQEQLRALIREVNQLTELSRVCPESRLFLYPVVYEKLARCFPELFSDHPEWVYPRVSSLQEFQQLLRNCEDTL